MTTTIKDNIGKEDIRLFGGNNRTFQRRNSSGALLTLHSVGNVVDVLQAYGDGTTPTQTDLSDAIVGANGNEVAFELAPGTWPITSNLTIPATVTLHLVRGAAFSVSAGVTLTINGPVFADDTAWYSGAGTVTVAATVSQVTGAAIKAGTTLECGTTLTVGTTAAIGTNATVGGTLGVTGAATVGGTLGVTGALTAVNLSATGTLGGKLAFRGARVTKSGVQSISPDTLTPISFDTESYDTDAIHDNSTNNTRLTVPAGVTIVSVYGLLKYAALLVEAAAYLRLNGTTYVAMGDDQINVITDPAFPDRSVCVVSIIGYPVSAGDYFELVGYQSEAGAWNLSADSTYFQMTIEA